MSVSVIIPAYNGQAFIGDAVRSVLVQSNIKIEIVVVDDGSSDSTAAVIRQFPEVSYLRKANGGVASARNLGIENAKYDLIALLDQDDRFLPGKLAAQVELMTANPAVVLTHTDVRVIDADGLPAADNRLAMRGGLKPPSGDVLIQLFKGNFVFACTAVFRKSVAEQAGLFDARLWGVDDYHLWMKLARHGPIVHVPEVLAEYRWHGSNASSDYQLMAVGKLRACQSLLDLVEQDPLGKDVAAFRHLFLRRVIDEAWVARQLRSGKESRELIALGLDVFRFRAELWKMYLASFVRSGAKR